MMIRLAALFVLFATLPLRAQEFPAFYSVTGVAADDVLNIRTEPDAASPVMGDLAPDAAGVEVISVSNGWALINADDGAGYVALDFLTREDGPEWNALSTPLDCLGTEPHWSLAIDPVAGEASFVTPENLEPRVSPIAKGWTGEPWARAAAVALPEGLVVLSPAQCSDGMSDRNYGIAVDVFLNEPDPFIGQPRLSGCCLLAQP
jgi:uncharacterized membrane protein